MVKSETRRDAETPRRRDRCLKIRDRDLNDFEKSEPETQCRENRARDLNYVRLQDDVRCEIRALLVA